MQTLEALERAIATTRDLQSIVRTMKVLAAVSIRQYERAVESLADYSRTVELGLTVALRSRRLWSPPRRRPLDQTGAVLFGSDHGLCGRFNEALVAFSMAELEQTAPGARLVCVGARTADALAGAGLAVDECFFVPGSAFGINVTVRQILVQVEQWQAAGIDKVLLFFNEHRPGAAFQPQMRVLLPPDLSDLSDHRRRPWPSRSLPTHTIAPEQLFASLLRQYLFITIFRASAESLASEHASRLISMQAAEKNIQDRLETLDASFRQKRQDSITEELLDVVSGCEAIRGKF